MRTIEDILRMSPQERRTEYEAVDIDKLIIDGNEFANYGEYSFIWEKTFVKSPVRATGNGAINNMNSYSTFLTPHLKINFSLMGIDVYRKIMQLLYSKNEFNVTCYDIVYNRKIENIKMYFATEEMPKLWTIAHKLQSGDYVELLGVKDYVVEMIGTNTESGLISIIYHSNFPDGSDIVSGTESFGRGTDFTVRKFSDFSNIFSEPDGYKFNSWNTKADGSGVKYLEDNVYYGITDLVLYAQYNSMALKTLTFNYGVGDAVLNNNGQSILSIPIIYQETYETAIQRANIILEDGSRLSGFPVSDLPIVTYDNEEYTPYDRKGWYTTSTIGNEQQPLKVTDTYQIDGDGTIYQIFAPKTYAITFDTQGGNSLSPITAEYNTLVELPTPTISGSGIIFAGWYISDSTKLITSLQMPPKNITLYAKWKSSGGIEV